MGVFYGRFSTGKKEQNRDMREKYLVRSEVENLVFGVRYDKKHSELQVIGPKCYIVGIHDACHDVLHLSPRDVIKHKFDGNRVRFWYKASRVKWMHGLKRLRMLFVLEKVRCFRRLGR